MTNYNDGKWHGWNGGECPVHPETTVSVKWSCNGVETSPQPAKYFVQWAGTHICAFRVVKEYREPREVYLWRADGVDWIPVQRGTPGAALFREVLPD